MLLLPLLRLPQPLPVLPQLNHSLVRSLHYILFATSCHKTLAFLLLFLLLLLLSFQLFILLCFSNLNLILLFFLLELFFTLPLLLSVYTFHQSEILSLTDLTVKLIAKTTPFWQFVFLFFCLFFFLSMFLLVFFVHSAAAIAVALTDINNFIVAMFTLSSTSSSPLRCRRPLWLCGRMSFHITVI